MATTNVVLISGANRGLGRGLTEAYAGRPSHTVIATVRNVDHPSAKSLAEVPCGANSHIIVMKIDSKVPADATTAVEQLKSHHGIDKLDIVIANAAIADCWKFTKETPPAEMLDHFAINVVGVLALFQATYPLLQTSATPKFVAVSSIIGSIADMDHLPFPATAPGITKAAINFLARKIHCENEWLIAFPLHPGFVQTDMGNRAARIVGMEQAPMTLEDSVKAQLVKIDEATRANSGGKFLTVDENPINW